MASGVLTSDNADLAKMRADQLTQFLSHESASRGPSTTAPSRSAGGVGGGEGAAAAAAEAAPVVGDGAQRVLKDIGTLWDERQYEEYSAEAFAESMAVMEQQ